MSPTVTSDIVSLCGKCGESWHVVVAMVGDKVVKVECKRCGRQHRYRDPNPKVDRSASAKAGDGTRAGRKPARGSRSGRAATKTVAPDPLRPSRPYRMSERFAAGEQIEHPRFGLGVVESEDGQGKIQVVFTDGKRVLVHAK